MEPTLSKAQIYDTVNAEHYDPFGVRGIHPVTVDGSPAMAVRTVHPDAQAVEVIPDNGRHPGRNMTMVHEQGLFEAVFPGEQDYFTYTLKIQKPSGDWITEHDLYTFPPLLSDYDLYLFAGGSHHKVYTKLGAHRMHLNNIQGCLFAVWAPNAKSVRVVGSFNDWDGRRHPMRVRGSSGVWELFIPGVSTGDLYKYEIKTSDNQIIIKADPYAFFTELRPKTASRVWDIDEYAWHDAAWLERRDSTDQLAQPISVYEVHLASWMRKVEENNRSLTYREIAPLLIDYVKDMGYTHIEFMPLAAHPFDPSWGYQVTGYYTPTPRFGEPEDLMYLIDQCHQHDIGVLVDWVPAHFPADGHSLVSFDGTCLYEHADPKEGRHPDWGTLVFNFGRNEVRNFLIANALFWLEKYHVDGLRVDAVASMLYRDYSRYEGEWVPNRYGGRENLEAIDFIKTLNQTLFSYHPGILMIAEESTAWPGVSRPTYLGGLGFSLKWNMGWMHDMLEYMSKLPIHRKYHQNLLTFALLYSFYENFVLPFSHDEVVHGKGAMIGKMPGYREEQFANLRVLLGYMFGHPGKKHLFMGCDIGQWAEWNHDSSVEWHLLDYEQHRKLQQLVRDLNALYRSEPALHELDFDHTGFEWIDFNDADNSVVSFIRKSRNGEQFVVCVYNFTPVVREQYRIGVTGGGYYRQVLNTDAPAYGGTGRGVAEGVNAESTPWQGRPFSVSMTLPPLGCVLLKRD